MTPLKRRIIDISYRNNLSHIGSCLTAVPIIDGIYAEIMERNNKDDKFILSSGHAGLALYVVLEKYYNVDAEKVLKRVGIHPDRATGKPMHLIHCTTGSLGLGLPVAIGMAIANRERNVYCLISDGECSEGSIWESLNFLDEYPLPNLKLHLNFNGYAAYKETNLSLLDKLDPFKHEINTYITLKPPLPQLPEFDGLGAHYSVLTKEMYEKLVEEDEQNEK